MKAANNSHSILSLPTDVLIETFKKLSIVDPKTPYKDLLHLGATCKILNKITKRYSYGWMKENWPTPPKGSNWLEQLGKVLSASPDGRKDLEHRLFREPMLRKLAVAAKSDKKMEKVSSSNVGFWMELEGNRERTPEALSKIYSLFKNLKDFPDEEKANQLKQVASLIPQLSDHYQCKVLDMMSGALMNQILLLPVEHLVDFVSTIIQMGLDNVIDKTAAIKFGLRAQFRDRRGFEISEDLIIASLNYLPVEKSFEWMKKNTPCIFATPHGIRCLVMSRSGCSHLASHWKETFPKAQDRVKLDSIMCLLYEAGDELYGLKDSRVLLKMAAKTLLELPIIRKPYHGKFDDNYLSALMLCVGLSKEYMTSEERLSLKRAVNDVLKLASDNGYFAEATALIFTIVRSNPQLLPSTPWPSDGFADTLKFLTEKIEHLEKPEHKTTMWKVILDWHVIPAVIAANDANAKKE